MAETLRLTTDCARCENFALRHAWRDVQHPGTPMARFNRPLLPLRRVALLGGAIVLVPGAQALILGGAMAIQGAAPADDPGWANIVSPNSCSGVYLGNRWVLTAGHVGAGAVTIGGTSYAVQAGSAIRLRTPDDAGVTDLALFRLAADPGLPELALAAETPGAGTAVTMIGCGRTRGAAVGYNSNWELNGTPFSYSGYAWGTAAKSWGTNELAGTVTANDGYGVCELLVTTFTSGAGATANEAQGAIYDSGGAVFAKISGAWRLAGIMVTIGTYPGQPGSTAIFGNATYAMDLARYRDQIETVRALDMPFDIWAYVKFRATIDAAADPDGDGFTNLEEYAYGLDPLVKNTASAAPQVALASYGDGSAVTATFTKNTLATDVTLVVEVSDDLVTWTFGDTATQTVSTTDLGSNVSRLVVRDLATTATTARRFLRVRVTR